MQQMQTAFGANGPFSLAFYALAHGIVEVVCAAFVISQSIAYSSSSVALAGWVLGYNCLAFGLRVILGTWVDVMGKAREASSYGLLLVTAGVLCAGSPVLGMVLMGLGNALFHIGGGSLVLLAAPRRAAWPGLFLAPGGLGISLGTLWGEGGSFPAFYLAFPLLICTAFSFWLHGYPVLKSPYEDLPGTTRAFYFGSLGEPELLLLGICAAVAGGSFLSFALHFPWKGDPRLIASAMAASALGRGLGGVVADKLGFGLTLGGALLGATPFLILGQDDPRLALPGLFLLNLPGPAMLVAVAELLPGRPGLSFGMVSLAILVGLFLFMAGLGIFLNPYMLALFLLLVSLPALVIAARRVV